MDDVECLDYAKAIVNFYELGMEKSMADCINRLRLKANKEPVADVRCNDGLSRQLDYWKTRCMRAEEYIKESPCDPDIYEEQRLACKRWQDKVAEKEPAA